MSSPADRTMATELRATLGEVVRLCIAAEDASYESPGEALRLVRVARSQLDACVPLLSHLQRVTAKLDLSAAADTGTSSSVSPALLTSLEVAR